jgi:glyoxalase family protein
LEQSPRAFRLELIRVITGLHHITIVCENAQRTVDFYTGVLGLRLVKQTVNFDDPTSYHLYFGDTTGAPGTAITFFEWPGAPRGRRGIGGTHHFALTVQDFAALLKWKRRLTDLGVNVNGPLDRHYFQSLYFTDPDGTIIELATRGPGWTVDEDADKLGMAQRDPPPEMTIANRDRDRIATTTHPEPVPHIMPDMALEHGMHHITANGTNIHRLQTFYGDVLGLRLVKRTSNFDDPSSAHWYWGVGDGNPGTIITYFENNPARVPRASMGAGLTHHYAFAVPDDATQLQMRERLLTAGIGVSEVMERVYFKSIYTRDPDGHIVEIATAGPGFLVDEDVQSLGSSLQLPPWLETQRPQITAGLKPLEVNPWRSALEAS